MQQCLLLFGDSITAGQYVSPRHRWTHLLRTADYSLLRDVPDFDVQAVSGETSRQALLRLPSLLNEGIHDAIVIQFGLNDANIWESEGGTHQRVSQEAFVANLGEAIIRAKLAGIRKIGLSTNHSVNKVTSPGIALQDLKIVYDELIRSVARREDVFCFDIAEHFQTLSYEDERNATLPPPDGLHLSVEGHKIYAHYIRDRLPSFLSN